MWAPACLFYALTLVVLTLVSACGGGGGTACVPGQQIACACPVGGDGVQVCLPDGSGYEACDCCKPSCAGKDCGGDGCGGSCGECTAPSACDAQGQCACTPLCGSLECGPDPVCGASCGECTAPESCQPDGTCACLADCADRECGEDGCGGSCGTCTAPEACQVDGTCACVPDCAGLACGPDPVCGASCGGCTTPDSCQPDGSCACIPDCGSRTCGPDPICGQSCGACTAPETCNALGQCECVPDCTGLDCGADPVCSLSCGECFGCHGESLPGLCYQGICMEVCCSDCSGRECGPDPTCGDSCGECTAPETCQADGTCACVPTCTGLACGLDPVCGASCGECLPGEACAADGRCLCDAGLLLDSADPLDAAHALDMCRDVLDARWVLPDGAPKPADPDYDLGHGLMNGFGPNVTTLTGSSLLALSTGAARRPTDPGFILPQDGLDKGYTSGFPVGGTIDVPFCPGSSNDPHDGVALQLHLQVPAWAVGLELGYSFYTADWPSYVCSAYNDIFAAYIAPAPQGSINGNIAFDNQTAPISANCNLLDVCGCAGGPPCSAGDWMYDCVLGTGALQGNGYGADLGGLDHASTGWQRLQAPVLAGSEITLTLMVYDSGDGIVDSTVLLDDLRWIPADP